MPTLAATLVPPPPPPSACASGAEGADNRAAAANTSDFPGVPVGVTASALNISEASAPGRCTCISPPEDLSGDGAARNGAEARASALAGGGREEPAAPLPPPPPPEAPSAAGGVVLPALGILRSALPATVGSAALTMLPGSDVDASEADGLLGTHPPFSAPPAKPPAEGLGPTAAAAAASEEGCR